MRLRTPWRAGFGDASRSPRGFLALDNGAYRWRGQPPVTCTAWPPVTALRAVSSGLNIPTENGKQVGRGLLLQGTQSDAIFWINGRLTGAVKAPTGYAQDFYDELPY